MRALSVNSGNLWLDYHYYCSVTTMKSFIDIDARLGGQPARMGVLLQRIDVGKGREALYRDQVPELLTSLATSARVESIRASNAIEGIEVPAERAIRIAGGGRFRNRNEREFAGYRDAIDGLMRDPPEEVSVPLMLHLHRQLFRHSDGGGGTFKQNANMIVSYESGRREVVFEPPDERQAPFLTQELVDRYLEAQRQQAAHPLLVLGAFALDFLAIHPVADGNGRLARLLTAAEMLRLGYGVVRYVSVEQQIYETRNAYHAALREAQRGWHEAQHDLWPWLEYLASVLHEAYDLFEQRVAAARQGGGSKQDRVRRHVLAQGGETFKLSDIRSALPGISDETIRLVLNDLKRNDLVSVEGRGRGALWRRL